LCRRYRAPCTLPYFIPVPAALGTLGAFIRLRSMLPNRPKLFDMAVAGPLAGFAALLPFLVYGIALSPVIRIDSGPPGGVIIPGANLGIWLVTRLVHGPLAPGTMLNLHPFVIAAWVGLLATSINLLPVGQLDGGHILYALVGERHRQIALVIWALISLGAFFYIGWLVWAVLLLVIGVGHPPVADLQPRLDAKRKALAALALLVLVFSFTPNPQRAVLVGSSRPTQKVSLPAHGSAPPARTSPAHR
jgi:membrane-associated protease RseP (regulator of RpoE activity)